MLVRQSGGPGESFRPAARLKDQALVGGALRLRRLPLQAQVLQCVLEVFVDLLRLLARLQVGKIFPDLLDELVQHLDSHLKGWGGNTQDLEATAGCNVSFPPPEPGVLACTSSYRVVLPLVEADVSVEDLDEKLDLQRWVHALVGNLQRFLQTLHHPLAITDLQTGASLARRGHRHPR